MARALERLTREHLVEPVPVRPSCGGWRAELWSAVRDEETWAAAVRAAQPAARATVGHWSAERKARLARPLELLLDRRAGHRRRAAGAGAEVAAAVSAMLGAPLVWLDPRAAA